MTIIKPLEYSNDKINQKLDALWDQTVKLTENLEEVKDAVKSQAAPLNETNDNIRKLDKRVTTTEAHLGIVPPPELTVTR